MSNGFNFNLTSTFNSIHSSTNLYIVTSAYETTRTIWSGELPRTLDQVMRLNLQRKKWKKDKNTQYVKQTYENCSFLWSPTIENQIHVQMCCACNSWVWKYKNEYFNLEMNCWKMKFCHLIRKVKWQQVTDVTHRLSLSVSRYETVIESEWFLCINLTQEKIWSMTQH